jgi:hypothetical protein
MSRSELSEMPISPDGEEFCGARTGGLAAVAAAAPGGGGGGGACRPPGGAFHSDA